MKKFFVFFTKWYALIVVAGAFVWSWAAIVMRRTEETPPNTMVIRIGHWQLEPGVRDGIDIMARKYEKEHWERYGSKEGNKWSGQKVKIIQDPIPESTYAQWFSAQMMGGTAPDIIECALGVPGHVLIGYYSRYFYPFTPYVSLPNPYNADNQFSNTAWRATFKDGMRGNYVEELQEYMTVPLSQFGMAIFYNKDLLRELTGQTEPPRNWQEFKAVCKLIASQKMPNGQFYIPIAASMYHYGAWDWMMADALSYGVVRQVDYSRDGWVDNMELFTAIKEGRVNFKSPPYEAKYGLLGELMQFFQTGFTGLGRDEGVFLFIQQRAVFITSGTWDQGALREQANGVFNMGIMKFPRPTKDDPDYGHIVEGPTYERPGSGFPFGIVRTSKHPDLARDFLHYLSGKEINEQFNQAIGWMPAVLDTKLTEDLGEFSPNLKGVYGGAQFTLGGDTVTKWEQLLSLFRVGQISFKDMMEQFEVVYKKKGQEEFEEMVRNDRRGIPGDERSVAALRAQMVNARQTGAAEEVADLEEARYRRMLLSRIMGRGLHQGMLMRVQEGKSPFAGGEPYAMSEEAKQFVRDKIARELQMSNDQQGTSNREVGE